MKNQVTRLTSLVLAVLMLLLALGGCANGDSVTTPPANDGTPTDQLTTPAETTPAETSPTQPQQLVELRLLTPQIGEHPESPWLTKTVDAFNELNKGAIQISIDGVAGEAVDKKLATDAASDSMPDLFILNADSARFNLMADSGRVTDLTPYLQADTALRDRIDADSAKAYTDKNGQLLGLPYAKGYLGIFYNKALFDAAGVTAFPSTWDAFVSDCDKLVASGVAPLSLMTGENSWTTMLLLSHILGTTPEGRQWLTYTPETAQFNEPALINAVAMLQPMLSKYTTGDAIGATYAVAANNFLNGKTAMIANGPWMIGEFSNPDTALPGLDQNVIYALAPGGGVIQMENIAYGIGSKTPEKKDAAFKFLQYLATDAVYAEFINVSGNAPCIDVDSSLLTLNPINAAFVPQAIEAPMRYGQFSNAVKPAVSDSLGQLLPDLASGALTPEAFVQRLQEISDSN